MDNSKGNNNNVPENIPENKTDKEKLPYPWMILIILKISEHEKEPRILNTIVNMIGDL